MKKVGTGTYEAFDVIENICIVGAIITFIADVLRTWLLFMSAFFTFTSIVIEIARWGWA